MMRGIHPLQTLEEEPGDIPWTYTTLAERSSRDIYHLGTQASITAPKAMEVDILLPRRASHEERRTQDESVRR